MTWFILARVLLVAAIVVRRGHAPADPRVAVHQRRLRAGLLALLIVLIEVRLRQTAVTSCSARYRRRRSACAVAKAITAGTDLAEHAR